jgi:hypothetical protein
MMIVIITLPSVAVVRVDVGVPPNMSRGSGANAIILFLRPHPAIFPQLLAQASHSRNSDRFHS